MCAVPNMAVFCSSLTSWFPGMVLTYFVNVFEMVPVAPIIIDKDTISFMQGIPETNHVPKECSVAAILLLLFVVPISLVSALALMYFYISTYPFHHHVLQCLACFISMIVAVIIIINLNWVVTRWQWLMLHVYRHEIGLLLNLLQEVYMRSM
jgi:hypothetical protein